jgi:uncharacterized phage protein (TIGR02220 family)
MNKEEPNYYAIIPANVRYADIPDKAKLLYGEITALCNKEGYCWANNTYFAELYQVHKNTISRLISILVKNNFLSIELTPQQKGVEVSRKLFIPILKNVEGGINKNAEDNNTSINNTYNNTIKNTITSNEVNQIIEYFNNIFQTKYRTTADRNKKIKLRLKSYSLDEIQKAINNLKQSSFHNGNNDRGWKAGIDFIIRNDEQIDKFLNSQNNTINYVQI